MISDLANVSATLEDFNIRTPPTVVKRKKPVDSSKFNQSNRKSKHCATFYFRHHDTDSDRQMIETDEKSQEESSEEEWTYVGGKAANEDGTEIPSLEIQCELPLNTNKSKKQSNQSTLGSSTPDLLRVENTRCKDIERLVNQAEELVQKKAHQHLAKQKSKITRAFKPLVFEEEGKIVTRNKMSRIKEWLNQSSETKEDVQVIYNFKLAYNAHKILLFHVKTEQPDVSFPEKKFS